MLWNIIKSAVRILVKNKIHTMINIVGLAIGLTAFMLISLWVVDEWNFDTYYQHTDRLYRTIWNIDGFEIPASPGPFANWLEEHVPEIETATRVNHGNEKLEFNSKTTTAVSRFVEPEFLQLFDIKFIYGDPKTALNDVNSIVLTESKAKQLFGNANPVGETVLSGFGQQYPKTITGVIQDIPRQTHPYIRHLGCLIPLEVMRYWRNPDSWDDSQDYKTYVLTNEPLEANVLSKKVTDAFTEFVQKYDPESAKRFKQSFFMQPFKDIHLHSNFKFDGVHGNYTSVLFMTIVAIFTLFIAIFNYINLSTAQSLKRVKEIGVRKFVGASRVNLISHFFMEAFIVSLIAISIAVFTTFALQPFFNQLTQKMVTLNLGDIKTYLYLGSFLVVITFLTGLYPSILTSRPTPKQAMQNMNSNPKPGKITSRKMIVIGQFVLSIIMIIATIFVYQQFNFMRTKDLGFEKENLVYLETEGFGEKYNVLKNELLQNPNIISVAASDQNPLNIGNNNGASWEGKQDDAGYISFPTIRVTENFAKTFDIKMAMGRFYSKDHPSDWTDAFVVNEAAVKAMGLQNPIGKKFSAWGQNGQIIGVIQDYHFRSLRSQIDPMILRLDGGYGYMHIRIQPEDVTATLNSIESIYKKHYPKQETSLHFYDDQIDEIYHNDEILAQLFLYFSTLAIFIACLGLWGLVLHISETKTKEIGIRKTLGSPILNIITLLLKNFIIWIVTANLIAWPLAWFVMNKWLHNFAYKIDLSVWPFLLAGFTALSIAMLTVSFQAIKAASANPVKALRYE